MEARSPMKRLLLLPLLLLSLTCMSVVANAQDDAARNATREKLRQLLETAGPKNDVNAAFRQATRNPYNFVATMESGFNYVDNLEVVISVTKDETIGFRIYPHYKGG